MSVAIGAQGVDLSQSMLFMGHDPSILDREGLMQEVVAGGELNYPWLISLSSQMGNAYTTALANTAHVFCEIESWEGMGGGGNQNWQGAGGHASIGAISIGWF